MIGCYWLRNGFGTLTAHLTAILPHNAERRPNCEAIGIKLAWYATVPSMSLFLGQEGG